MEAAYRHNAGDKEVRLEGESMIERDRDRDNEIDVQRAAQMMNERNEELEWEQEMEIIRDREIEIELKNEEQAMPKRRLETRGAIEVYRSEAGCVCIKQEGVIGDDDQIIIMEDGDVPVVVKWLEEIIQEPK